MGSGGERGELERWSAAAGLPWKGDFEEEQDFSSGRGHNPRWTRRRIA